MNTSISHLPEKAQYDLNLLIDIIRKELGNRCHMIILYGSYANGNYVVWDQYMEGHTRLTYKSDYDILVVTSKVNPSQAESDLGRKLLKNFEKAIIRDERTTFTHIIAEDIKTLNAHLERSQYFYTEIINEGIMLYNSEKFTLATPRELNFDEVKEISEKYFKNSFPFADRFLKNCWSDFRDKEYKMGSFNAHQACEKFYKTINTVFSHYRPKEHDLKSLSTHVKSYSVELNSVFPTTTEFEKHCYEILCDAYIDARYNDKFVVTKDELAYLLTRIELLKEITERICKEKIASIGQ